MNLADCKQDSGKKYLIPVVLTANGQSVTYTVKVREAGYRLRDTESARRGWM